MSTDAKISFYNSAKDVSPTREISIKEVVRMIHDETCGRAVAAVRAAKTEDEKRLAKMRLPAVQLSGHVTSGNRAQAIQQGRFEHSGWLQLDVDDDGLNGKTPLEARALLGADAHVLTAFITPSGKGAKALFKIAPCGDAEEHKAAFLAAETYIKNTYGLTIDGQTKDSARLCFLSADRGRTWNENVQEFVPPPESLTDLPSVKVSVPSKGGAIKISSGNFPPPPKNGIHSWLMEAAWFCRLQSNMSEAEAMSKLESFNGSLRREYQENEVVNAVRKVYSSPLPEDKRPSCDPDDLSIPPNVFPVPAGPISLTDAAAIIFPVLAKTGRMFLRAGAITEVTTKTELEKITKERLQNVMENCGYDIKRREAGTGRQEGKVLWRKTIFPVGSCGSIMENDHARIHLPEIKFISSCPIFAKREGILGPGYHEKMGVYITAGAILPAIPFEAARDALWNILADFDFVTRADKSRALASLISPALKMGGWINDDFPLDVAEADQSQSGKTYRQKIVQRIFNEAPEAITQRAGGVGSLDESVSGALMRGRPFVLMDNFRGKLDSTLLESAIRGAGTVYCRVPHKIGAMVDCQPFMWQLSTNGAELTRDLANRSIITRIRKKPPTFQFTPFPEGSLEHHVTANQAFFLGCVFAIVREWETAGCPTTNEHRHDFRGWCQALDWIVQHLFQMPPLLDGHREEQNRVGNPNLQWLRDIVIAAPKSSIGRNLNTGELLDIAEDAGILMPGNSHSKDEPAIRAGRILAKLFRETEGGEILVDGFLVGRGEAPDYSATANGALRKFYTIKTT